MKNRLTVIIDRPDRSNTKEAAAAIKDVLKALRPLARKHNLRVRVARAMSTVFEDKAWGK